MAEIIEIWQPTDGKDGEAYDWKTGKHLKRVALLAEGEPLFLSEGIVMERRKITDEELTNLISFRR